MDLVLPDDLTDDALTGGFRLLQRRRGHRYSLDDVLTAYRALHAVEAGKASRRCLDLGCGIGSVLLMTAYKLPDAAMAGIEAQAQSFALVSENARRNGVAARTQLVHGDFRERSVLAQVEGPFDLVTGTPPYQPVGAGTVSPDSQRAHARVEMRGGVEAYLEAAGQCVAEDGVVVMCGDARSPERVERGAAVAGLFVHAVCEAVPAVHKSPLFSVWTLRRFPAQNVARDTFVARTADGARSADYRKVRFFFDLESSTAELSSPPVRPRTGHVGQRLQNSEKLS